MTLTRSITSCERFQQMFKHPNVPLCLSPCSFFFPFVQAPRCKDHAEEGGEPDKNGKDDYDERA